MNKLPRLYKRPDSGSGEAKQTVVALKKTMLNYNAVFLCHRARIVRGFKCEVKRISPVAIGQYCTSDFWRRSLSSRW